MTGISGWDVWEAADRCDGLVVGQRPLPAAFGGGAYCGSDPAVIVIDERPSRTSASSRRQSLTEPQTPSVPEGLP